MSRFSKQIFTIIIFSLIFISCGGNSTSEVVEIQETTTTLTTTTSTSTTTTTLTTTTSTLPDIMPTVLINCEPVESFTMAEGYMNFNFEITTGTNELVVLNIVSWFDSSRTDDLFIYDGLDKLIQILYDPRVLKVVPMNLDIYIFYLIIF